MSFELLLMALDMAYQREAVPPGARLPPDAGVAVGVDVGLGVGVFVAAGVAVGVDVGAGVDVGDALLANACTSVMRACLAVLPAILTLPTTRKPLAEIGSPLKVYVWPAAELA